MAFVIGDACIMCGACAEGCPVGAISEGDGKYVIDAGACLDCGACADQCPVGAIEGYLLSRKRAASRLLVFSFHYV